MRIAIVTIGTMGDILPYIALGKRLRSAGDQVKMITFQDFEALIRCHGLDFYPLSGQMSELMERDWTQSHLAKGSLLQSFRQMRQLSATTRELFTQWMADILQGCAQVDIVLGQVVGHLFAQEVARKLGVPYCATYTAPITRTRAFPGSFSIFPSAPGWHGQGKGTYNWLTQTLSAHVFQLLIRPVMKKARGSALDLLSEPRSSRWPIIYGYSSTVLPKPVEWEPHITVAGYWFLDQSDGWQPSPELLAFLDAGTPPLYVGFGSMNQAAKAVTLKVIKALENLHLRCILLGEETEWPECPASESVFWLKWAPHEWLLPHMSVIMHHGGAGTTGAALRAGVPQVIIPLIADQHFWGHLVETLQGGPAPLKRKKLQVAQVEQAITIAMTEAVRERAQALGACISTENGCDLAVQTIHACVPAVLQAEKEVLASS